MIYGPDAIRRPAPAQSQDVLDLQWERWRLMREAHTKWAQPAAKCVDYYEGRQLDAATIAALESTGRKALVINKIKPLVNLLVGFWRQNRYDVKYRPGNDGSGTGEVADALTAAAKQIAEANQSDWLDAAVFQDGIVTGRGWLDSRIDFSSNILGEVKERRINPFSVYIDPEGDDADPTTWLDTIESRWMSPVEIATLYGADVALQIGPNRNSRPVGGYDTSGSVEDVGPPRTFNEGETLFESRRSSDLWDHFNQGRRLVRVLDRQHYALRKVREFVDLQTGLTKQVPEHWKLDRLREVMALVTARGLPVGFRESIRRVIRWTVTAADLVLFDDWSPYETPTRLPYFAYFRDGITRGMVHDLVDPQDEINKRRMAQLHIIATMANSGWLIEEESLTEEMEQALENEGARPGIVIKFKSGKTAPQRINPAPPPTAWKMLEDAAASDIKEISGINDSALGQLDRVQSGRAIEARQRQTIVGSEGLLDNFRRYREIKGRKILELVQNHYTEERLLRIRGDKGDELVWLNRREAAGQIINNVSFGRYDVAVDEAPASATFVQAQFEEAIQLRSLQTPVPIPDDILIDLSSMPSKEEVKRRMTEERALAEQRQRAEATMMSLQAGKPPDMPWPSIPVGGPRTIRVNVPAPPGAGPPGVPQGPAPPGPRPLPVPPGANQPPPEGGFFVT